METANWLVYVMVESLRKTDRTIRVLMVIPSFVPAPGGTQRFVYELASRLTSKNVLTSIVTTTLWWSGPQSHAMLEPEKMHESDASAGFRIVRITPRLLRGYPLFFGFECVGNLSTFDVIHIHGTLDALPYYLPLFLTGRVLGKRFIVTIHMIFSASGNWFNGVLNNLGLLILNLSSAVTVGSPNDVVRVSRLLRESSKVELMLPGVDYYAKEPYKVDIESGDPHKRNFNLLTVGSLDVTKGIDVAIKALAFLSSFTNIRYLIVGPDVGEGEYLKKLVRDLRLEDKVQFMGYVLDRDRLRRYYEQADVVVIPSRYETTSLVALEAMALGKPIVATMVGGLQFLIRNEMNGILVQPSSPQALASAIERLYKNVTLRTHLALGAAQASKKYSWDDVSSKFASLYHQVMENH